MICLLQSCSKHIPDSPDPNSEEIREGGVSISGKKEGVWKKWNKQGGLVELSTYKDGERNGLAISYYQNGKEYIKCYYKNDSLFGKYEMYYSSGQKNAQRMYGKGGRSDGPMSVWYEDGTLSQSGFYKNGKRIDRWTEYSRDGNISNIKIYTKGGKKDGQWIEFNENGDTLFVSFYKDDSLLSLRKFK